jgi:hypothetical protein
VSDDPFQMAASHVNLARTSKEKVSSIIMHMILGNSLKLYICKNGHKIVKFPLNQLIRNFSVNSLLVAKQC